MNTPTARPPAQPIGVLAALATGFDRISARPALILPLFLLDLFLWLGPQLRISALIRNAVGLLLALPGRDPAFGVQIQAFREATEVLADRFNLFSVLTDPPTGLPSLMSGRMPILLLDIPGLIGARMPETSPLGAPHVIQVESPFWIILAWIGLALLGCGMGAFYHRIIARQLAPKANLDPAWLTWARIAMLGLLLFLGLLAFSVVLTLVASLMGLILPLLGAVVVFLGFSLLFWVGVYLVFTPHAIVRGRMNVWRAMTESAQIVRWNLLSSVGFLASSMIISWIGHLIWALPREETWFVSLAVIGHAFFSAILLAGSYAFFQSRRTWTVALKGALAGQMADSSAPPNESLDHETDQGLQRDDF